MRLCRFRRADDADARARLGFVHGDQVSEIPEPVATGLAALIEDAEPAARLADLAGQAELRRISLGSVTLLPPVDAQEVWAAGVTYERSRQARMDESEFSASAYDRVYAAERPEIFFKALPAKVSGPGDPIGVRADSRWTVPEPELALLMNAAGRVVGCTIGNDVSARDIEGENLLYLPQAKVYRHSCALGPWLVLGATEAEVRSWNVRMDIVRAGECVFSDATSLSRIRRSFDELAAFLFRSQDLPYGACLLTGTGIVPPDDFTLRPGDEVLVEIDGIGCLRNPVVTV